jgi:dihydroxyacetone kinase-like protein
MMANACTATEVIAAITRMADTVARHKDYLTELDSAIGDADHGINLDRGFAAARAKLPELEGQDIGAMLKAVGMTLVSTVGGASGPLYGSAFLYAGNFAAGKTELTLADLAQMWAAAEAAIVKRGGARVGDKTMLDALAPVAAYLAECSADGTETPAGLWAHCAERARQGMEATIPLMALKGRASFLKERSVGHADPGATSLYYLVRAIAALPDEA